MTEPQLPAMSAAIAKVVAEEDEIARLKEENKRLREALVAMVGDSEYKSITICPGEVLPLMWVRICMPSAKALDLARAALEPEA